MLAQSSLELSPPKQSSFDEVVLEMENKVKWPIKTEMATGLDVLVLTSKSVSLTLECIIYFKTLG